MKIAEIQPQTFGIKFIKNDAFKQVEAYAHKIKLEKDFYRALSILERNGEGDVLIQHGIDKKGKHYSNFTLKNITVENTPYFDETYIETTFRTISDLSLLGGRYRTLTDTNKIKTRA